MPTASPLVRRTVLPIVVLSVALLFVACEGPGNLTGPPLEPQLHVVPEAEPDLDYRMRFTDFDPVHNLFVNVTQTWTGDPYSTQCPVNEGSHAHLGDEPEFPGEANMAEVDAGGGWFRLSTSDGVKRGVIKVKKACWFDEWNAKGFPESAWISGFAYIGWRFTAVPFAARLTSRGFPELEHLLAWQLDRAFVLLGSYAQVDMQGQLHHENH